MIARRRLLTGFIAAPLVVRDYSILMPVRKLLVPPPDQFALFVGEAASFGEYLTRSLLVASVSSSAVTVSVNGFKMRRVT